MFPSGSVCRAGLRGFGEGRVELCSAGVQAGGEESAVAMQTQTRAPGGCVPWNPQPQDPQGALGTASTPGEGRPWCSGCARTASQHCRHHTTLNPLGDGEDERASRLPLIPIPFPDAGPEPEGGGSAQPPVGAGETPGCWDSGRARGCPTAPVCPVSVCPVSVCPATTEGAPGKQVPLQGWAGRTGTRAGPSPALSLSPCSHPSASPARGAEPAAREGRDAHTCPSPISRVFMKLLFWKSCRSAAFRSIFPIPASRRFSRAPWAFSEMSNPRRSPQHLQCFVTALAKC